MRKFPKLVAIVLAIAIVICPAMCLSAMADSPNGYSLSYNEGVLTITVTSETGFMVSYLNIDIEGYAVDEENITVTTAEGRAFSANPIFEDGVLALLVAPTEAYDISLVTEAVVSVPLEELVEAERYYIALTKIQAADAGSAEVPESFLVFDGVDANGYVEEVIPTVDALPHECDVVEYVDNGDGTHNGVCDCEDATVLIENEDHIDEDADNVCDYCDAALEAPHECDVVEYVDNGDGTHNGVCDCEDATVLIENEDHIDEDADNVCDYCLADLEVEDVCEHTNVTFVSSILPTANTTGSLTLNCENCGEYTVDLFYNKYARAGYASANAEEQTLISFSAYYDRDFGRIDENGSWDAMFLTVEQSRNGDAIDSAIFTIPDCEIGVSNGYDAYKVYYGLPAYAYVDDMTATVYVYDSVADKWYSGPQNITSLKTMAESIIPSATGIKQTMWVDLLNYGAAAQLNFEINTENLANADIDDYQGVATTPAAYENNLNVSAGSDPTPFYYYMFTGVVESKITLRTYFRFPNNYTGTYAGETGENIKAVATWTSYTGETVTYEAFLGEDGFNLLSDRTDRWDFYLPLGAPDLRANITFTIVYMDGENETVVSPVATTSFESYVATNYASGSDEFKNLCDAMMAFGDSANAYLTQN